MRICGVSRDNKESRRYHTGISCSFVLRQTPPLGDRAERLMPNPIFLWHADLPSAPGLKSCGGSLFRFSVVEVPAKRHNPPLRSRTQLAFCQAKRRCGEQICKILERVSAVKGMTVSYEQPTVFAMLHAITGRSCGRRDFFLFSAIKEKETASVLRSVSFLILFLALYEISHTL